MAINRTCMLLRRQLQLSVDALVKVRSNSARWLHYVQGQTPEPGVREYFYFIDHQGMLFLDDSKMKNFTSCFKEKQFLEFFFKRLRVNQSGKYEQEFPYVSLCGRERNYTRCDDLPIVFTHVIESTDGRQYFAYGHAGERLIVPFQPEGLCMLPETGRVYHPAPERVGGVGLVRSAFAIEISKDFVFEGDSSKSMPTKFKWHGVVHELNNGVLNILKKNKRLID